MKKIKTFFKKDPNDLGKVIDVVLEENKWVYEFGIPTKKFDGTSCAIINSNLYKRYDVKINKKTGKRKAIPINAIPCQEADPHGSFPHWVLCERNDKSNKYHFEGFDGLTNKEDGTYELCGEKTQKNPEKIKGHKLIKHESIILQNVPLAFNDLRNYLKDFDGEGIVFHHKLDERKCKIRKSDFGFKRFH